MPRNPFQRPVPVTHNHNVPRHGAPIPVRKPEMKKLTQSKQDGPALPPLEELLARDKGR
jgi:hypothetical protein